MYHTMIGHGGNWLAEILNFIFWLLILTVIVMLIMYFARMTASSSARSYDKALSIARERYAKGEITKREYEQIKEDLSE